MVFYTTIMTRKDKTMRSLNYKEESIKIFGIPTWDEKKEFRRLPKELIELFTGKLMAFPRVGTRCPGARLCFRTNSEKFKVKITLETLSPDLGMSIFAGKSANVFIGERANARFAGLVHPDNYEMKVFEKEFTKNSEMEDITIFLPMAEIISDVEISIEEDSKIEAPTPYRYSKPILFYGSSITEGGHATRPSNAYNALLSSRLDFDYFNLGFSGGAKGNPELAEFIGSLDLSVFVFDYDHNAPDAEHLAATHEPFFKKIREKQPDLPVVMMTSPDFDYAPDKAQRREIVRKTYDNAKAVGDENVYFIDGETFFGKKDRHCCTTDTCHPNDLGHYRMANVIEPVLREILEKSR